MTERTAHKVVEVQIAPPHERRVMAVDLTEPQADEFIKFAVMRRGVRTHFYVTETYSDDEQPVKP
jgi:hypothetical protein